MGSLVNLSALITAGILVQLAQCQGSQTLQERLQSELEEVEVDPGRKIGERLIEPSRNWIYMAVYIHIYIYW